MTFHTFIFLDHPRRTAVPVLKERCKSLIHTISESDIDTDDEMLLMSTAFSGTMRVHQFKWARSASRI